MRLFDSHTHLFMEPLGGELEGVLRRARAGGVGRMVVPAFDRASWKAAKLLARRPGVHCALGVHPWAADGGVDIDQLAEAIGDARALAVGEIGLDGKVDVPMEKQIQILEEQLELAVDLNLPVILHCRGEFDLLLSLLGRLGRPVSGVFHAFSRGPQLAARLLDLGLHLGIGGAVTRPGARRIRRALPGIPISRMLLETDSPSMGMEGVPAGGSEPADVHRVCVAAAKVLGVEASELADSTWRNASGLFGLA